MERKLLYVLLLIGTLCYSQRGKLYQGLPDETYYKNGDLRVKRKFQKGIIKNYSTYYKNGALRSYYAFNKKGEHDSISTFYYPNGKIRTEWIYKKDVVRKRTDFDTKGEIISDKKDYDKIKECNGGLMRDRNNLNWVFRRANTNLHLQYFDEAIEDYMFLESKSSPKFVRWSAEKKFYHNIAIAYSAIEDYENSLKYNFKALSFDSKNQAVLNNIGHLFFLANDYDLSMNYLNKCHEVNPNNYYAFFNKSLIYFERGNIKKAYEFIRKTIADERSHKNLFRNFDEERNLWTTSGEISFKLGNNAKAISDLNKALKKNEVNSYAYKCLGDVYMSMNIHDQACRYYYLALKYKYDLVHNEPQFNESYNNSCNF